MNITLHRRTVKILKAHIAEWEDVDFNDVDDGDVEKLVNQMVVRESDNGNLSEEYSE